MDVQSLVHEQVWREKPYYDKMMRLHFEKLAKVVADKMHVIQYGPDLNCTSTSVSQDLVNNGTAAAAATAATAATAAATSKKSKDKKLKAATRHRNAKKFKTDTVEPKEQITISLESQQSICPIIPASGSLANEIAKARQHIKKSLQCMNGTATSASSTDVSLQEVVARVASLEKDNQELRNTVKDLKVIVQQMETKLSLNSWPSLQICPAKPPNASSPPKATDAGDDDVDLFGSDSEGEDDEAAKVREKRVAAYNAKKSKKPVLIAKSNIILDIKPWDDETDMKVMETEVRKITCDGLLWGAAKLVPLAYGIHKLQISCVVEDEKVSVDWLTEAIQEIEEYVQSVDIAAFNKV